MNRILEIRAYNLKPGTRDTLHELFVSQSLPMLQRWNVDVVAYGPSLGEPDSYFLMRSYASLEDRQQSQDAFYGSDEWRKGPREAIIALIDTFTNAVIEVDEATLQGLRSR
jgi:NIPSNAP protein